MGAISFSNMTSNPNVKIYSLSCPVSNEVKYIGKTVKTLHRRLYSHLYTAHEKTVTGKWKNDYLLVRWVRKMCSMGLKPIIELVEECEESNWQEVESFYISYFRFLGFKLKNQTEGGEGLHGYIQTEQHKRNSGLARTGKKWTEEQRSRIKGRKSYNKGIPMSEEQKIKISKSNTGKKHTEETKLKLKLILSRALEGKSKPPRSDAHKKNLSIALKGKPAHNKGKKRSVESIEKQRKSMIGKNIGIKRTPETKEKIRLAKLGKKTGPLSERHKKNISLALMGKTKGRKFSEEHRNKISLALIGRKNPTSDKTKEKLRLIHAGRKLSDAHKEAIRQSWIRTRHKRTLFADHIVEEIKKMLLMGLSHRKIAKQIKISASAVNQWIKKNYDV